MGNKSGTDIISAPKGGGALKGLGEKFSPDLHTGTGNYSVPIELPPGRNGLQPTLSLDYSTGNGNTPFGLGWGLSLPGISRKTAKGVPVYDDDRDVFILSGSEDLAATARDGTVTRYRPRTEGMFARIAHIKNPEQDLDYWEVTGKDGMFSRYGTMHPIGQDKQAVIVDPANFRRIYAWKLSRTQDTYGNHIVFSYQRDGMSGGGGLHRPWDQIYLRDIRYVDHGDPANPDYVIKIAFEYEERPDPFSEFRSGFEVRTALRCKRIKVYAMLDRPFLTRIYTLEYFDETSGNKDKLPPNRVSLLAAIYVQGLREDDGQISTQSLPPLTFSYGNFRPEKRKFQPVTGKGLPPCSLAHPNYELVDLFGNGLPDIIEINHQARYWRNLGRGRFDLPRNMDTAPAGLSLADPGVQLIDADGDGRADLLVSKPGLCGYFSLNFNGEWDRGSFKAYHHTPGFNLENPEVRLLDLTGDGVTDIIRSGESFQCFFNDAEKGWSTTRLVNRAQLEEFPDVTFADPHVKWADMTGDGMTDIVLIHDGRIDYWPSLGYGDFAARVTMRNCPHFPCGFDPKRILIGDVDGDGVADLAYVDNNQVTLWINQSGNAWSEPIVIAGTPAVTEMDAVRLVDLLGTGVAGILWSRNAQTTPVDTMHFLDFTGGHKPYLLESMNNNMGAITRVGYAPSIECYLADQKRGLDWVSTLPFPVQVVARVETIDEISGGKLTSEYSYHHGYWDGAEREFRGFGRVDQRDTESFQDYHATGLDNSGCEFNSVERKYYSPPTETRTWFHQGPIGPEYGAWQEMDLSAEFWPEDPRVFTRGETTHRLILELNSQNRRAARDAIRTLRGRILRSEFYALDGSVCEDRPYTVSESSYGIRQEDQGLKHGKPVFFSFSETQRTTQWERGHDPMTQMEFAGNYDEFGQCRLKLNVAVPRGRNFRKQLDQAAEEIYLATRTYTAYAQPVDPDMYIHDRIAHTTVHQVKDDKRMSAHALWEAVLAEQNALFPSAVYMPEIVSQIINYYDGDAFSGRPVGEIGEHGALMRAEQLVLTEQMIADVYGSESPPYLRQGNSGWDVAYPEKFKLRLEQNGAGYHYHGSSPGMYSGGYYAAIAQNHYNAQGLVVSTRDPLHNETGMIFDAFALFAEKTITPGPACLETAALYDYQAWQPKAVIDQNGNATRFAFTPLGLVRSVFLPPDEGRASHEFSYDYHAFAERRLPVYVHHRQFVYHDAGDISPAQRGESVETREYSDGLGRILQTRIQAEAVMFGDEQSGGNVLETAQNPNAVNNLLRGRTRAGDDPNVVVSGWQVYDNKGRVIEKNEPFFAAGWDYTQAGDSIPAQKIIQKYDARGRVWQTMNTDQSWHQTVYGKPVDIADPDAFVPTPWEHYVYDANDNAGRTPLAADSKNTPLPHLNTPVSFVLDALGRVVAKTERNGQDSQNDWQTTKTAYDIQANILEMKDAWQRPAFSYKYDLAQRQLEVKPLDSGARIIVLDAAGNQIEYRDAKGSWKFNQYDALNRLTHMWAKDRQAETVTLREYIVYGDDPLVAGELSAAVRKQRNLLGRIYKHYDEAGLITYVACDFRDNILEKKRQVVSDEAIQEALNNNQTFRVAWQPAAHSTTADNCDEILGQTNPIYVGTYAYDGMGRLIKLIFPETADGSRKSMHLAYNHAGALQGVELDGAVFVRHIAYNARGQRTFIAYGNNVITRYAYDTQTFRLARMRSEPYLETGEHQFQFSQKPLQEYGYFYDLAGNIVEIMDLVEGCGTGATPNALQRCFTYDPLYRLLTATGREHDIPLPDVPWSDPGQHDVTATRAYTESYTYDCLGNMKSIGRGGNGQRYLRNFELDPGTNRLQSLKIGDGLTFAYTYEYDESGNVIRETSSRHFEWDHGNRMRLCKIQPDPGPASVQVHYLYAAGGQRVKKYLVKNGETESVVYIDGVFEYRRTSGVHACVNNVLHVLDGEQRIAVTRIGPAFHGDDTPAVKYILGDHLHGSSLCVGPDGHWINREEFTPYAETSFGSHAFKRYRYSGKERDTETGLYYYGARYYAPWLGRWISTDPAGPAAGLNAYAFVNGNPMNQIDRHGLEGEGNAAQNASAGQTGHQNLKNTLQSKGGRGPRILGEEVVYQQPEANVKGSRGDILTTTRSMESKNIDLNKYLKKNGEFKKGPLQSKLRKNYRQALKHMEALEKNRARLEARFETRVPVRETVVYTVEGPAAAQAQFRTFSRNYMQQLGGEVKVGTLNVLGCVAPMVVLIALENVVAENKEKAARIMARSTPPSQAEIERCQEQGYIYTPATSDYGTSPRWTYNPDWKIKARDAILQISNPFYSIDIDKWLDKSLPPAERSAALNST
ncbi:VCBS repeat-containing protein [candidate division FCPU426 bacterium]|nr:VCBS repeat-containing protein [candidate division FCPU426 bacterium]